MESCLYEGRVSHARLGAIEHRFQYSFFMLYLDLDEWPALVKRHWALSCAKVAPAAFRREDHFGDAKMPLATSVRNLVESETGDRPQGPIRMLTQLRYWGYYFSPLNLFYCFGADGKTVEAIVAEVSNTPWGERHCYVLWEGNRQSAEPLRFRHPKLFHVSPFMGMDAEYVWKLNAPGEHLTVGIESRRDDKPIFRAGMSLGRREISGRQLTTTLLSYPVVTAKIVAAIYFEALRLWWKKCPYFPHPKNSDGSAQALTGAS